MEKFQAPSGKYLSQIHACWQGAALSKTVSLAHPLRMELHLPLTAPSSKLAVQMELLHRRELAHLLRLTALKSLIAQFTWQ